MPSPPTPPQTLPHGRPQWSGHLSPLHEAHGFRLPRGVAPAAGLAECNAGTRRRRVFQGSFTARRALCALPARLSPADVGPLAVPTVVPFPECHLRWGHTWVASSDHLLSLSDVHLSFLCVFSWLAR